MSDPVHLSVDLEDGIQVIRARGEWTAPNASTLEEELDSIIKGHEDRDRFCLNMQDVQRLDTYGAWLAERVGRMLKAKGAMYEIVGLEVKNQPLFDVVHDLEVDGEKAQQQNSWLPIDALNEALTEVTRVSRMILALFGAVVSAFIGLLRNPGGFRLTAAVHQFEQIFWKALPITVLVTAIIGAVIAQQGFFHFRDFGAELYVVDMVGFLVMRDIGVLLVAIVVAGRSGSAFTAEIGSMKMREEIDALRTMGTDPVQILILPRILTLIIALPMLTFVGCMAALAGAGLVAVFYQGMAYELFLDRLNEAITLSHFKVGMIKAPFIGAVIALIGCAQGLMVKDSAISLGHHTTKSVVQSIFMVIVLDGLFAIFFTAIRM